MFAKNTLFLLNPNLATQVGGGFNRNSLRLDVSPSGNGFDIMATIPVTPHVEIFGNVIATPHGITNPGAGIAIKADLK